MKKMNLMMAMAMAMTSMMGASDAKAEKVTFMSNGQEMTVEMDYCWVNGHIEPCLFQLQQQQQAADDSGACWDPVSKSYKPCL